MRCTLPGPITKVQPGSPLDQMAMSDMAERDEDVTADSFDTVAP